MYRADFDADLGVELQAAGVVAGTIYDRIADDLLAEGCSIQAHALPEALLQALYAECQSLSSQDFDEAGIGRGQEGQVDTRIRRDEICWITPEMTAGSEWLAWSAELMQALNRRLFLGLFSFESHFAHYAPGDFYARHLDAFQGRSNRRLSMVVYLNPDWPEDAGGELALYQNEQDQIGLLVRPTWGTVAIFLSEEFPHEVLPATMDRYSIAGWFSINTSSEDRVDPPA